MRPRLLDLFCGAGGCSVGYHRAGFEVVGVDIAPQPNYPFEFRHLDALDMLDALLRDGNLPWDRFDAIHASPPCQGYTSMNNRHGSGSPRLIEGMRELLKEAGLPYAIENVSGARSHLDHPIQLCGRALGLGVARHRLFECSFPVFATQCACRGDELPVYGKLDGRRLWTRVDGSELRAARTIEQASEAMGVDWMTWDELRESVPPAYTEHIGPYLMAEVRARQEAAA